MHTPPLQVEMRTNPDPAPAAVLTVDEYEQLPEQAGFRLELSRGRLVRERRPGMEHGWIGGQLYRRIEAHVRSRELGLVLIEAGFRLSVRTPTVRAPDVTFLAAARLPPERILPGFYPGAPDLAVEVLSPFNTAAEIHEKVLEYLEAGTRLVWIVDPISRSVTAWRPPADARVLREGKSLDGLDVLPGFTLEVSQAFPP